MSVHNIDLPGNMTVNGEDSKIVEIKAGDSTTWLGQISTEPIKDQIRTLAQQYCDTPETAWGDAAAKAGQPLSATGTVTGNATDGFTVTNTKKDEPVVTPTDEPTGEPTTGPTTEPTSEPTTGPTSEPTDELTTEPSGEPTASAAVTSAPTAGPGSAIPTARL